MLGHAITIVDDDDNILEQLRRVLGAAGYTVHTFNRPESAYDAVRANPPDAVIIGIQFPNCQPGIDLATALKLRPATRALPIILTADDTARLRLYTDRPHGSAVVALWALARPIDASALLPLLTQVIGQLERAVP
jgi:DNA-binding response OmpR family regulator